jgi:glucose/mannose-6-phosphate isomerase
MTVSLDDAGVRARLDPDGSYERIHNLPEQCLEAWQQVRDFALPAGYAGVDKLVVTGMGGSAIAADCLQALVYPESRIPISVVRGYRLPAWVDSKTLVVGCSHSGHTEETLSAFGQAVAGGAKTLAITTGGEMASIASAKGIPLLQYSYPNVPRDAFGHGFLRLIAVARALGMLAVDDARIAAAVGEMRAQREALAADVLETDNAAKQAARRLDGFLPLVIGAELMAPVARRWRGQIDENADVLALWDELPEADHNLVVGLRHPGALKSVRAVFLDHESTQPRARLRYDLTSELFESSGIACDRFLFAQPDRLAAQLCAVHHGDFVSYYLAMLTGTRPAEIDNINWLKDRLARQQS